MLKKRILAKNSHVKSLWHPNVNIVRFSPFLMIIFLLVNFGKPFTTRNAQRSFSHCPSTSDYRRSSSSAPIKPVSRHYSRLINVARVPNVGQHQIVSRQKRWKSDDFFIWMPQSNFLLELTFSTYPHKLQNLSFNLAVIYFFCAPKDFEHIAKTNGSRTLDTPCTLCMSVQRQTSQFLAIKMNNFFHHNPIS
jgi:hypothetical protein